MHIPVLYFPQDTKPTITTAGRAAVPAVKDTGSKQHIRDSIRMIVRGTLGSCSSSSECKRLAHFYQREDVNGCVRAISNVFCVHRS